MADDILLTAAVNLLSLFPFILRFDVPFINKKKEKKEKEKEKEKRKQLSKI